MSRRRSPRPPTTTGTPIGAGLFVKTAREAGQAGCVQRARANWDLANKQMKLAVKRPAGNRRTKALTAAKELIVGCAVWEHVARFGPDNVEPDEVDAVRKRLDEQYRRDPAEFAVMLARRIDHLPA